MKYKNISPRLIRSPRRTEKNKKALSLIEIMVVVAIIMIMSSVMLVAFYSSSSKSSILLDLSQRKVAAAIKLAQSYAIQGKTQLIDGKQETPCGYGFHFTDSDSFEIFYNKKSDGRSCQVINSGVDPGDATYSIESVKFQWSIDNSVSLESYDLEKNISLNLPAATDFKSVTSIYFSTPQANVYGSSGNPLAGYSYNLKNSFGKIKAITISSRGHILEE
jgi:type II secretory pathway pseudopilin PulG